MVVYATERFSGRAAFHHALHLDPSGHVDASHFMTFHVPLRNSTAYIEAMNSARLIAQKMEEELGDNVTVFPYRLDEASLIIYKNLQRILRIL